MVDSSISTFAVVTFDLVAGHLYSDSLGCFIFDIMRSWRTGLTDCRDFPDYPVSGLVGTLYPLDGNWNLASFDSSSDLCDLSDFTKYHYWTQRELIRVYRGWDCLWND